MDYYTFCKMSATSRQAALVNNYHFMCLHGGQLQSPYYTRNDLIIVSFPPRFAFFK